MIETAIHQLLSESAQKTLETMFFAVPESVSMDPLRPAGELIAASLVFQGAPPGRFGLLVSEPLAMSLALNFTGGEDIVSLPLAQVAGVMGELANMLCGVVLSELESYNNFDLGAPEPMLVEAEEPGPDFSAGSPSVCRLEFPEGALVFFLAFEEPV
jgi:hypothetical protein